MKKFVLIKLTKKQQKGVFLEKTKKKKEGVIMFCQIIKGGNNKHFTPKKSPTPKDYEDAFKKVFSKNAKK